MDQITVVGLDIGKTSFHVVAVDASGAVQLKRRCSRAQLMALMAKLTDCRVAMEACCGAHHLARAIASFSHDVKLIAPQFVKPFLKSNKNDYLDAEAIAEAVQRPTNREHRKDRSRLSAPACDPWRRTDRRDRTGRGRW